MPFKFKNIQKPLSSLLCLANVRFIKGVFGLSRGINGKVNNLIGKLKIETLKRKKSFGV